MNQVKRDDESRRERRGIVTRMRRRKRRRRVFEGNWEIYQKSRLSLVADLQRDDSLCHATFLFATFKHSIFQINFCANFGKLGNLSEEPAEEETPGR